MTTPTPEHRRAHAEIPAVFERFFVTMYQAILKSGGQIAETQVLNELDLAYPDVNFQEAEALAVRHHVFQPARYPGGSYTLFPDHERGFQEVKAYHPAIKTMTTPSV